MSLSQSIKICPDCILKWDSKTKSPIDLDLSHDAAITHLVRGTPRSQA
jgi:hypothetical protein